MTSPAFGMRITPSAADIDELGHVNNAAYVRWLQDIATAHWRAAATADDQARYFWVVSRHEIDYLKATLPGESLTAETWGENPRGARFDRRIDLTGPDGSLRVSARTTWVLMDRALARPARVSRHIGALFQRA
jgi:acyl-CoA thioester hydrolase